MKKIFLIITCAFYCFLLSAQESLSGKYYSKSGLCLQIEKDSFKLILQNTAHCGFSNQILAEGGLKLIDESFMELDSKDIPSIKASRSINIEQKTDSTFNDSIQISFLIPYQKGKLEILVLTDKFKDFEFNYSKDNQNLKISKDIDLIRFTIQPDYIMPHTSEGSFYGVMEFNSLNYPIEKNANSIKISIPAMDDSFFEKYYVKRDYARISQDSITWKGEVFVKEKSSQ